jgi:ATP:ADP antiporter, AAA family
MIKASMQVPHDDVDDPKIKVQPVKLWKKVVPLAIIFFLSSFNLTILQALKDAIVVTTSGAEALPFLASLVVLPASVIFFGYYAKLLSAIPRHRVYYLAILPFVLFYGFFAGVVYPMSDSLHFHGLFDQVCSASCPRVGV